MANFKAVLNTTVQIAKKGCEFVGPIVATLMLSETARDMLGKIRYVGKVNYDDTVRAILDSSMMSSYKKEVIAMLKIGESSEYYRAIINTVQSSMMSSDKVEIIRNLSGNVKEEES